MRQLTLKLPPRPTQSPEADQSAYDGPRAEIQKSLKYFQLVDATNSGRDVARFVVIFSIFDPVTSTIREEQVTRWDVTSLAQAGSGTNDNKYHASWIGQTLHYGLFDLSVMRLDTNDAIKACRKRLRSRIRKGKLQVPEEIRKLEQSLRRRAKIKSLQEEEAAAMQGSQFDSTVHASPKLASAMPMAEDDQDSDVERNTMQSKEEIDKGPRHTSDRSRHSSGLVTRPQETPSTTTRALYRRLADIGSIPVPLRFREKDTTND